MKQPKVLGCIAPASYQSILRRKLGEINIQIRFRRRNDDVLNSYPKNDPYYIEQLAKSLKNKVDAILLIAPRHRSAKNIIPRPVIEGLSIGLLFSNQPEDLDSWFKGLKEQTQGTSTWAILSKWSDYYISRSLRVAKWLRGYNPEGVETWFADEVSRDELCQKLATGPRLAWYMGHARAQGLSAYYGVRYRHLEEVSEFAPCGSVICLACDTLKQVRKTLPFGCDWVLSGRAAAYFGSVASISMYSTLNMAYEIGAVIENRRALVLGDILVQLENRFQQFKSLKKTHQAFKTYRIIGNPLQPLL